MNVITIAQPETQLGNEISELLASGAQFTEITFVSAFVGLRTILRLREALLGQVENGATLRFTVGIDLFGTSKEVLDELMRWNCNVSIFRNANPRATFHPKFYLFRSPTNATLFLGSNNLTDGGFFTNYEAATRYDFSFPEDNEDYHEIIGPLNQLATDERAERKELDAALIQTLVERGEIPTEREARQRRQDTGRNRTATETPLPPNPFEAVPVRMPPLLAPNLRGEEPQGERAPEEAPAPPVVEATQTPPTRMLVWQKRLSASDAQEVKPGSNPVGCIRLVQAEFEGPDGRIIDQTTYFRNLFADFPWEPDGRHTDQEKTFVPMRIFIRGTDYGVRNFEISHKPSGEAGQGNYTTSLRWGRDFTPTVTRERLTGLVLALYQSTDEREPFYIEIGNG